MTGSKAGCARRAAVWGLLAPMVATVTSLPLQAQQQAATPFAIDDGIDMVQVSSPVISPDGQRLLFIRTELDWEKNKRNGRIWIAGADGDGARPYTGQVDDRSPQWSPDGAWVSFVRGVGDEDKVNQIFLLPTDGGEALQLTRHPTSVGRYEWARDGSGVFYLADDSLATELEAERKNGGDAIFIDEGPNGQTRGEWNGVWWIPAETDTAKARARRLTPEGIRVSDFAASPAADRLAYVSRSENRRNAGHLAEITVLDVGSGTTRVLTDNDAPESQLAWSPDGSRISFVAPHLERWELDQGNLYVMSVASGQVRQLADGYDGDLREYEWAPDGTAVHGLALVRTDVHLIRIDASTGAVTQTSDRVGVISSPSFSRSHGRVAFVHQAPDRLPDVYVSDLDRFEPRRVTDANPWLASRILRSPEVVRWTSSDGLEIEGLLYRPDRSGPGPLVLEIHGGPAGVFSRGFDVDAQLLTTRGYAVLQPNVRGSSGYGDALLRGNMNDIGGGDFQDVMTGVDHVIGLGVAHPDSLAVKGWSYGGILGGWTITQTDRFKAASLGAMVADWRSEFGAGFNFDVVRWYLGGDPWSNPDVWTERSAYSHLDKVSTPTILFHGANDTTDTMEQSMNFFAGLRHLGVDARFLLFPREGHGIAEPRHRRTLMVEEIRWLETYVRGNADWTPPERPSSKPVAEQN